MRIALSIRNYVHGGVLGILLVLAGGCATSSKTPPPSDEIAELRLAIQQAEQVGAREYAPLEIRNAEQKLEQAQTAIENEEHDRAVRLLDQAKVDAELAQTIALSSKATEAATELQASIQALRDEIQKNQNDSRNN